MKKKNCFHFSFVATLDLAAALLKTISIYPEHITNLSLYDTEEEFPDAADEPCAAYEQLRPIGAAD